MYRSYRTPADFALELLTQKTRHSEFWALKGVSFDIRRGEVVGILGRNGAGKSTLLKILTGVLDRTSGTVEVNGRLSAILELGTGFHSEYTGRENIRMGGLCLGMTEAEVAEKTESIIEFSELREFIDRPFRTYSSGMQARLTFSVAACIDPDVLIVDEALSVGDARFQRRCYRKFAEFRSRGCTILFVSHQTGVIESVCDRAIYLADSKVAADGHPRDVVGQYMKDVFGAKEEKKRAPTAVAQQAQPQELRYGTGEATIVDCGILDSMGERADTLTSGARYILYCDVRCNTELIDDLLVGFSITTTEGVRLVASNPQDHAMTLPPLCKGELLRATLGIEMNIGLGDYFVSFGARGIFTDRHYDRRVDALHLLIRGSPCLGQSLVNMKPEYGFVVSGRQP